MSSGFESAISYLMTPSAKENRKIAMKNIFCLLSKSAITNFLNKNIITERKIKKIAKVIPNLKKEHKKIAPMNPAIEIIKE